MLLRVLARLEREVIDVEVEVTFPRRRYRGWVHRDRQCLRVVGLKDEAIGEYQWSTEQPRVN